MCAYRSLFAFIDFKLMQKSLEQIAISYVDIRSTNDEGDDVDEQINTDIKDYASAFAHEFCTNMRTDMHAQVTFIESLEKKVRETANLNDVVEFCAGAYNDLGLFNPKITGLSSDTFLFNAEEFCTVYAMAITEIKAAETNIGQPMHGPKIEMTPSIKAFDLIDYAKALQIVAHEIYLDKQHQNIRTNCDNTAFMT